MLDSTSSSHGNALALHQSRKTMVLGFTFKELGPSSDACWWTPLVVRRTIIDKVVGGWSRMLRDFLNMHLLSATGIQTAGLPLVLDGKITLI